MSAAADLQDRRRAAEAKARRRMIEFLIDDDRFDSLRVEDVKMIAAQAGLHTWDAIVEVSS